MNMMVSAAALASASSVVNALEIDPIFEAIEKHKHVSVDFTLLLDEHYRLEEELPKAKRQSNIDAWEEKIVETDDNRWVRNVLALEKCLINERAAACQLVDVTPTTLAGVLALLKYATDYVEAGQDWPRELVEDGSPDTAPSKDWSFFLNRNIANALMKIAS